MNVAPRCAAWIGTFLIGASAGVVPAHAQGRAPAFDAFVTLSNDYRHRGISLLDSGVSWQLGFDYEHASRFFVGAAAANIGYAIEDGRAARREHVLDFYLGYGWGERDWAFNVALGVYAYPGFALDYDYEELRFAASYMNRFFYNASYAPSMLSSSYSAWNHELGFAQPLRGDFELSAALGRLEASGAIGAGYTHWNAGVSTVIRRVGVDLRYYDAALEYPSYFGNPDGERWVLSVSYGFAPAR